MVKETKKKQRFNSDIQLSDKDFEIIDSNIQLEIIIEERVWSGIATKEDMAVLVAHTKGKTPSRRALFVLGLAYFLGTYYKKDPVKGKEYFNEVLKGSSLMCLKVAHAYFEMGDEYYDDIIIALKAAEKEGSQIAKELLNEIANGELLKFPEA